MFTWICPKCGSDVPPAYDECPRCHPPKPREEVPQQAAVPPPAPPAAPSEPAQATGGFGATLYVPPGAARPQAPVAAAAQAAPPAVPAPVPVTAPALAPAPAPQTAAYPAADYSAPPARRSTGLRDLGITVGVAAVLMAIGFFVWNRMDKTAEPEETKAPIEDVKKQKAKAHPLSNQIEVGGFRITEPKEGQLEIKALVINHSPASIADLQMDVELMAKGTDKLVAAFPITLKRLGPYETAETSASVKTTMRAYELPDWQFLQARIVIQSTAQ